MKAKRSLAALAAAALFLHSIPVVFAEDAKKTVRVRVENSTFSKDDGAAWDGVLLDTEVEIGDGDTMYTVIAAAVEDEGYQLVAPDYGTGPYIMDINGVGVDTAANVPGEYPGWTSTLNDWFINQGVSSFTVADGTLEAGDEIAVLYTITWLDCGGSYMNNDTSLKALEFSAGELDKEFDPAVTEYTLTLSGEEEIYVTPTAANKNFQVRTYKNSYVPETKGAEYKRSEAVPVADGDKLFIGVGDPAWPTMNYSEGGIPKTLYTVTIVNDTTEQDNEAAAAEVEALIDAIGEVTLDSEDAINEAYTAYSRLTDEQKALVDNYDVLEAAMAKLAELKADTGSTSFNDMFNETAEALSKTDPVIGNEWKAIGLARAGKISDTYLANMSKALREYVDTVQDGKFNARRSTENSKESVLAAALGIDPEKISGRDILAAITDKDFTAAQGINGQIWANIALTGVGKDSAYRDILIAAQLENGAFSFDGETADVDITAMAVTALALDDSDEAKAAVAKAVEWLSSVQGDDGSYGSCESTAQVMIALSSVGINTETDERFIKNGSSLMDGLSVYYLGNGAFSHLAGAKEDGLATEQAFLALAAHYRLSNGMTAIYDFSDVKLTSDEAEQEKPADGGSNPATGAAAGAAFSAVLLAAVMLAAKKRS
ncbi:MAG: DUF4430 domain-containing protein [Ruminococcus sp.]|nr:DUF4430 domain-containing protein [Ruminococcus sp.]